MEKQSRVLVAKITAVATWAILACSSKPEHSALMDQISVLKQYDDGTRRNYLSSNTSSTSEWQKLAAFRRGQK